MKKIGFLITLNLLFLSAFSQNQFNCNSHNYLEEQLSNNPEYRNNREQLEKFTAEYIKNNSANKTASASYIIPVVFHVIYTNGPGNISDAQILDQINILNAEFPRQQPDTALTPNAFKPFAAPFSVEFRLATIDPLGNCTNGINRIYNSLSNCSLGNDDIKALSYWPSNKYLNIWLVQSMHYSGNLNCVGGGYATFPGGIATLDGINIRGDLISNIGTAATNGSWGNFKGRYLIHELGHWFNLRHIWGDATCGNDFVSDTPPAVNDNSGCPSFPRNPNNSCGSDANGEMYTDYMDYTNGPCLNMFTAGQVARMTACINSPVSGRNNLWSNANLNATGTNNPYTYPPNCVATPEILPFAPIYACVTDSVKFTDYSYGGMSTSRLWNFSGGNASSLTDSIVKVKYSAPGTYSLTLTKNYLSSSKTATFTNKVYVFSNIANPSYTVPFSDGFENTTAFNNDWTIINRNNDAASWQNVNNTNFSGNNCMSISNFGQSAPSTDDLISPAYNMGAVTDATLTFRMHFATTATTNIDKLEVSISSDCGLSWFPLYTKNASNTLKTIPSLQVGPYVPVAASSDWRLEKISIDDFYLSDNVRFKFSFTSGGGNNIFIDDVNLNGINSVGIKNNFFVGGIKVFPNPATEQLNVSYTLKNKTAIQFEIIDVIGKICLVQISDRINEGENISSINLSDLKSGIYFIRIKQNDMTIYNSKFVK